MGSALAKQLRAPVPGSCMGWMAQHIMSMGNGADSIIELMLSRNSLQLQLQLLVIVPVVENPVIVEIGPGCHLDMP